MSNCYLADNLIIDERAHKMRKTKVKKSVGMCVLQMSKYG